jgi:hypothetical protein
MHSNLDVRVAANGRQVTLANVNRRGCCRQAVAVYLNIDTNTCNEWKCGAVELRVIVPACLETGGYPKPIHVV